MERVWDRFLSPRDKEHLALAGAPLSIGFGQSPALLLIDNFREALGDEPKPLLEAVHDNPSVMGLEGWAAVHAQRQLLDVARKLDLPVIHVTKAVAGNVPGWAYCVTHPELRGELRGPIPAKAGGNEIVDEVAPTEREYVISKVAPSAFWGTPLIGLLNFLKIDTLVVGGESTSGCVRATVIDATSNRYRVIIAEECVYDRTEASHAINLFDMNQKYADVLPLQEVIEKLEAR